MLQHPPAFLVSRNLLFDLLKEICPILLNSSSAFR